MNKDRTRLLHIQDAIEDILHYAQTQRPNKMAEDAITRQLQVIGEASRKISPEFQEQHPVIPWKEIIGLRLIVVHEYMKVDSEIIWRTVDEDIPTLKKNVDIILKQ